MLNKYIAILKSIEQNDALNKKWMNDILKDWKKNEVVDIAKSGGSIIKKPFRSKKTKEYKRFRKWQVPVNWCLGVWTGATLYSLMKGKGVGGVNIISKVDANKIVYGYSGNKWINFNVGVSDAFISKHEELLKDKVSNYIKEAVASL